MYVVLKFLSCLQFQYQTARCGNIYYQERAFGIFKLCTTIQYKSRPPLHSMPSNSGRRKSASWHRVEIKLQVRWCRMHKPIFNGFLSALVCVKSLNLQIIWQRIKTKYIFWQYIIMASSVHYLITTKWERDKITRKSSHRCARRRSTVLGKFP